MRTTRRISNQRYASFLISWKLGRRCVFRMETRFLWLVRGGFRRLTRDVLPRWFFFGSRMSRRRAQSEFWGRGGIVVHVRALVVHEFSAGVGVGPAVIRHRVVRLSGPRVASPDALAGSPVSRGPGLPQPRTPLRVSKGAA